MLCLTGASALSAFRLERLLRQLQGAADEVTAVSAQFRYYLDMPADALESAALARLEALLDATVEASVDAPADAREVGKPEPAATANGDGRTDDPHDESGSLAVPGNFINAAGKHISCWVVPRFGTRSPWSSKATDILHNCGFNDIPRVERGIVWQLAGLTTVSDGVAALLHDRMVESLVLEEQAIAALFDQGAPAPLTRIALGGEGLESLEQANRDLGLALSADELAYLGDHFRSINRDPSDAELMMFAQANSEHCRHKLFNASWTLDGVSQPESLFGMIRHTHKVSPAGVLSAYHDNAAVIEGYEASRWMVQPDGRYAATREAAHIQIKVETHNHPTAIAPFPGAATGAGGEIRDEGATGNGSKPKAGLCGFTVSNLHLPALPQPWESDVGKPDRIASALDIMIEGPIGAAAFNDEFGRPNLAGYFRTFCQLVARPDGDEVRGYHKPVMIAGGLGNIRPCNIAKLPVPDGAAIVVLGGPSMQIGLGGGAASSVASGAGDAELDFSSVQRGNPEMQRRCQEVIDACIALGEMSPVLSMHDVGAGGLSNALPELVADAQRGGSFRLRDIPNEEAGMSPMALWSNESQERYVLAVDPARLATFEALCQRERCVYAVVGEATEIESLIVSDAVFDNRPVDMPLDVLLGKPPKLSIDAHHRRFHESEFKTASLDLDEAVVRVLQLPAVAAKNFLITIGDRSVTGLVARDQLVGPWQMPVADVAVTLADYRGVSGEAMAMGERSPLALINPAASARMALGESLTNILAANIGSTGNVKLSANWMAAAGHPGEEAALFDAVQAVGMELAPALGIAIPVGKDSLSMQTVWQEQGESRSVVSPMTLICSAFAPVTDARLTVTPQLRTDCGDTDLVLVDLGGGQNRLGGSALAQVYGALGNTAPDVDDPALLKGLFNAMQQLIERQLVLAWHDRSDGGLFVTLAEMAFAGNTGVRAELGSLPRDVVASLFNEELGGVLQIRRTAYADVMAVFELAGIGDHVHVIGSLCDTPDVECWQDGELLYSAPLTTLKQIWWQTSYEIQRLRDNPDCAEQERAHIALSDDPGLSPELSFDPGTSVFDAAPAWLKTRPPVAILREQGVNGQLEMAAAFDAAGFDCTDVHMTDLITGRVDLSAFRGLVAVGGFSYGDVLGAGGGWARSILYSDVLNEQFRTFFAREDTFALGVCNGCQMLSQLRSLIPGTDAWPAFRRNLSEQFEARLATVQVYDSPSLFFTDMAGSRLPVAVAHGEGRAVFDDDAALKSARVALGYVDNHGAMTEHYPLNPNGSAFGVTGLCNDDGRVTILMPHPERVFRTITHSWHPPGWGPNGPWLRMFENARVWTG